MVGILFLFVVIWRDEGDEMRLDFFVGVAVDVLFRGDGLLDLFGKGEVGIQVCLLYVPKDQMHLPHLFESLSIPHRGVADHLLTLRLHGSNWSNVMKIKGTNSCLHARFG